VLEGGGRQGLANSPSRINFNCCSFDRSCWRGCADLAALDRGAARPPADKVTDSSSSSSSSKSRTVARDSCDLKKYSWEAVLDCCLLHCEFVCQASVSPQSSLSYSESLGPSSSLSDTSRATRLASMLATSLSPADCV